MPGERALFRLPKVSAKTWRMLVPKFMVITTDPCSIYIGLQFSLPPGFVKNIFLKSFSSLFGIKNIFELFWAFHLSIMCWVFSNIKGSKQVFNTLRKL